MSVNRRKEGFSGFECYTIYPALTYHNPDDTFFLANVSINTYTSTIVMQPVSTGYQMLARSHYNFAMIVLVVILSFSYLHKRWLRMLRPIDNYFLQKEEPVKSCLQFLREHILQQNSQITEAWKYGMPFYCIKGKMFCYLWVHKKLHLPYIGIVEGKRVNHPDLIQEKRARMKILLLDPNKDMPVRKINAILQEVLSLY